MPHYSSIVMTSHDKPAHPNSSSGPASATVVLRPSPPVPANPPGDRRQAQFPAISKRRTAVHSPWLPLDAGENYRCRTATETNQLALAVPRSSRDQPHPAPAPHLTEE